MDAVESILQNGGFNQIEENLRQKIWEKRIGDAVYRIMLPFKFNTFYFYEYTKTLTPVSFVEFHNYTSAGQLDRLQRILP